MGDYEINSIEKISDPCPEYKKDSTKEEKPKD